MGNTNDGFEEKIKFEEASRIDLKKLFSKGAVASLFTADSSNFYLRLNNEEFVVIEKNGTIKSIVDCGHKFDAYKTDGKEIYLLDYPQRLSIAKGNEIKRINFNDNTPSVFSGKIAINDGNVYVRTGYSEITVVNNNGQIKSKINLGWEVECLVSYNGNVYALLGSYRQELATIKDDAIVSKIELEQKVGTLLPSRNHLYATIYDSTPGTLAATGITTIDRETPIIDLGKGIRQIVDGGEYLYAKVGDSKIALVSGATIRESDLGEKAEEIAADRERQHLHVLTPDKEIITFKPHKYYVVPEEKMGLLAASR